ncbi:ROK family transcriptional regulator [Williamsia sterculiae]|uniref:Transcriptional regulator, MarR family n=1 Tax=Williamsia sterculiae TaxID=1344003 RepID=A0A1N7FJI1_9NOCA|nr:ROK family transcriptional regulator [Williamsia sterculiae]SIS00434.1 transcriptional regulator, MarR family [Williamsia sterculiae]
MAGIESEAAPGSPRALRDLNRRRVLEGLREYGDLTQAQLSRRTGLAPATVSNIVQQLKTTGDVVVSHGAGRRRTVRLAPGAGFVLGVDLGHRHVAVVLADLDHDLFVEERVALDPEVSAADGMAETARLTEKVLRAAGVDRSEIISAAMGLPAPIDRTTRKVGSPTILPGWVGLDAEEVASSTLDLPVRVHVDNDANLGALAEWWWGAGAGYSDVVYLKLSDGVGAGLIINSTLYSGVSGTAGEIGHMTIDEYGDVCRCGNRGCLETFVSASKVSSLLAPIVGNDLPIAEIVRLADDGDRACARVLADVGKQVGRSLADLCSLLNPQLILIGGELAQATAQMTTQMQAVIARCGVPAAGEAVQIRPAGLGPRTQLMGTVAMAMREAPRVFNS